MGAVPAGGNVWKSIIIGVLTTVTAYVIVHFIFDKKDDSGFKKKKEATISAWQAILKSNEFFLDDYYAVFCQKSKDKIAANLHRVIDRQMNDYELLQKKPDLDDDLGLYINRYLERCRDMKEILQDYFDAVKQVENEPLITEISKQAKLAQVDSSYMPRFTGLLTQDADKIETLYTGLTKKYGDEFKHLQKPAVTEDVIKGVWGDGKTTFRFNSGGNFTMTMDGGFEMPGKWLLDNNKLTLNFDGEKIFYHIIYYGKDYFRFTVNDLKDERQVCRQ